MNRLEEIKKRFNAMGELESFKKLSPTELFFGDLEWLIQQAERVGALNAAIDETKFDEERLRDKYKNLWQENHRHKQALSFYADPIIYDSRHGLEIFKDSGAKARQVMRGDK